MHVLRCEPGRASQLELVSFVLLRERFVATLPDFFVAEVRLRAAAARFVAPFAVLLFAELRAEVFAPPRAEDRAVDFREVFADVLAPPLLAADRFAPAFFAAVFLAPAFFAAPRADDRAAVFLAADFRAPPFFAAPRADDRAAVFLAPAFLAPAFLAVLFFAPAFLAAVFFAPAFLAAPLFAPARAPVFAAAFVDLRAVVERLRVVFVSGVVISPVSPAIPALVSSIG
jgi:hypothetical protein